jgi:hypothetical protein
MKHDASSQDRSDPDRRHTRHDRRIVAQLAAVLFLITLAFLAAVNLSRGEDGQNAWRAVQEAGAQSGESRPPHQSTASGQVEPIVVTTRPRDDDVTAALFLLVRNDVAPDVFICPTTQPVKDTLGHP